MVQRVALSARLPADADVSSQEGGQAFSQLAGIHAAFHLSIALELFSVNASLTGYYRIDESKPPKPRPFHYSFSDTASIRMETIYTGIDFGSHSIYVTTTRGSSGQQCCSEMASVMNCFKQERRIRYSRAVLLTRRSVMGMYKNIVYACDGSMINVCFYSSLLKRSTK